MKYFAAGEEKIIEDSCLKCIHEGSSKCSNEFPNNSISRGPFYISREYWIESGINQGTDFEPCVDNYKCASEVVRQYVVKHTISNLPNTDYALCYEFGKVHGHAVIDKFDDNRYQTAEEKIIKDTCLTCIHEASSKCSNIFPKNSLSRGPFYISREYWIKSGINQEIDFESCVDDNYQCASEVVRKYVVKHTKSNLPNSDYALCYEFGKVHGRAVINKFNVNRYHSFYCYYEMFNNCYIQALKDTLEKMRFNARPRWG
ncbi:hypothetical protein HCN44_002835 [Aphidius gifuensis]|uniref:lysozyme n=1 Tax=Aphidius gifuensis TaxID=684658 RepID=A0A834XPW9_APHGI|nr:hypothetical protein HCN44_002835 [Aphidius gifuensis]